MRRRRMRRRRRGGEEEEERRRRTRRREGGGEEEEDKEERRRRRAGGGEDKEERRRRTRRRKGGGGEEEGEEGEEVEEEEQKGEDDYDNDVCYSQVVFKINKGTMCSEASEFVKEVASSNHNGIKFSLPLGDSQISFKRVATRGGFGVSAVLPTTGTHPQKVIVISLNYSPRCLAR